MSIAPSATGSAPRQRTRLQPPILLAFWLLLTTLLTHPSARAIAPAVTLVRWPYLQQVTPHSARVIWATDAQGSPAFEYAVSYGSATLLIPVASRRVTTPDGDYYEHRVVLGNLAPDTWYTYRIYDAGVNLTPHGERQFQTAPLDGGFTFFVIGDTGTGTTAQRALRDLMTARWAETRLLVHTGDLGYPYGSYAEFQAYCFDIYRELFAQRPLYPVIGNHEYLTQNGAPFLDLFDLPIDPNWPWHPGEAERYYSFDVGSVHFVFLDSQDPLRRISDTATDDMADWLAYDLADDDHLWQIAVIHRPPYSSSPAHPETDVRTTLVPLFERYGVDLVLSGHSHNYERSLPLREDSVTTVDGGGIVYIVTGGGGASLYDVPGDWFTAARAKKHHFVQIQVNDCALTITAIDDAGAVIDRAVLEKCPYDLYIPLLAAP